MPCCGFVTADARRLRFETSAMVVDSKGFKRDKGHEFTQVRPLTVEVKAYVLLWIVLTGFILQGATLTALAFDCLFSLAVRLLSP